MLGAIVLLVLTILAMSLATASPALGNDARRWRDSQSGQEQVEPQQRPAHRYRTSREDRVRKVIAAAMSARGVPYQYGGTSRSGFDCSGFTRWAWAHAGVNLPHNSSQQYSVVRWHVSLRQLQPGDLLFFYSPISHVGLYLGRGRMIDASHTGTRIHPHAVFW